MAASWLCALLLATAHGFLAPHSILPVAEGENYVSFAIGILFFSAIAFYAAIVLTPPVDRSKRD